MLDDAAPQRSEIREHDEYVDHRLQASVWAFRFACCLLLINFALIGLTFANRQDDCRERQANAMTSNERARVLRQFMRMEDATKLAVLIPDERVPSCRLLPF